ncbi:MAG: sulfite exporter TauE/SafE family protein, partial [Actinomycetota bacterium]|nr:sulfite exporter TauE/SafE family protein [Actinomycetota bacterium]
VHGLDWSITLPLMIGSVPGSILGSRIAPRVPQSIIRRGIVIVLTMSGVALLDKAGWAPLGAGKDQTHPMLIAAIGIGLVVLIPIVWGLLRRSVGLPMRGAPTVAELEGEHDQRAQPPTVADLEGKPDRRSEATVAD